MVVASQMTTLATDDSNLLSRYLPSRVARGFVVAIISGLFFTGLNASVKELAHEMPPLFVSWGRWVAGIALMVYGLIQSIRERMGEGHGFFAS